VREALERLGHDEAVHGGHGKVADSGKKRWHGQVKELCKGGTELQAR
jgi:hypothetical protein